MSPARGRHRQARLTPPPRAPPERMPGSSPPSALPATVTRHFPHRFSPPHGERSGTPARIAWERIVSPVATGTETPWGRKRMVPVPGSDIGGGEGGGRQPPQVGGERGRFLRAHEDPPSRQLLDLS